MGYLWKPCLGTAIDKISLWRFSEKFASSLSQYNTRHTIYHQVQDRPVALFYRSDINRTPFCKTPHISAITLHTLKYIDVPCLVLFEGLDTKRPLILSQLC